MLAGLNFLDNMEFILAYSTKKILTIMVQKTRAMWTTSVSHPFENFRGLFLCKIPVEVRSMTYRKSGPKGWARSACVSVETRGVNVN
jgi:hypothetical protein